MAIEQARIATPVTGAYARRAVVAGVTSPARQATAVGAGSLRSPGTEGEDSVNGEMSKAAGLVIAALDDLGDDAVAMESTWQIEEIRDRLDALLNAKRKKATMADLAATLIHAVDHVTAEWGELVGVLAQALAEAYGVTPAQGRAASARLDQGADQLDGERRGRCGGVPAVDLVSASRNAGSCCAWMMCSTTTRTAVGYSESSRPIRFGQPVPNG
jgi:hypothetical protein